jgi:putative ABC transport system permease protein
MFQNHLKLAWRSLSRDRFYTLLNGLGLAVGMAVALLVFLWVNDEMSFDDFHKKGDRIYRVVATWPTDPSMSAGAWTPQPFADAAREKVPGIEQVVRFWNVRGAALDFDEKRFGTSQFFLADSEIFKIFDFQFLHGHPGTAFRFPNNVVLTAGLAERIFGTTDVVGQPLKLFGTTPLTVSAVLADLPSNSHLQFEALLPFRENVGTVIGDWANTWTSFNFSTYVLLRPGVELAQINKKLNELMPPKQSFQRDNAVFELQPLRDVYLHSEFIQFGSSPQGSLSSIRLVAVIGLLILLIACVNYVNMSTARSMHRAKSVGVRKIVGAGRWDLFKHFLTETTLLVGGAGLLSFAVAHLSLDLFEQLTGKHFTEQQLYTAETGWIILGTILTTVLFSGVQPAIQMSGFRALDMLRGGHATGAPKKEWLRKVLVTSQFLCSGALIIGTCIVMAQLHFIRAEKLGYELDHIFAFNIYEAEPQRVIEELRKQPGVLEVTASNQLVLDIGNSYRGFDYEGKDPQSDPFISLINADDRFADFFGLELKEGRWFHAGNEDYDSYILNETAVRKLGIEDPIGKWMVFNDHRAPIVGVMKDFHFQSLHNEIEPLILTQNPAWHRQIYVKTSGEDAAVAIAAAGRVFGHSEPSALFDYQFLNESYDQLYKSEMRSGQLFSLFAVLAVFISCLGILGLAAWSSERRSKEIGIRRILGASLSGIVGLLSKDVLQPVLFATLLACVPAWYFTKSWLENFAYRIELSWWMFAVGAGLTFVIAWLTVSFQSIKAATADPVESLRSE